MAVTVRDLLRHHLSLLHGWIPITAQVLAGIALVAAICWGIRRWRYVWVPCAALCGIALTVTAYWYVESEGLAGNPAPVGLWVWIGLTGASAGVLIAGWRGATWWRRGVCGRGGAAVLGMCRIRAEPVDRVLPHCADRVESVDRRPAARSDGSGDRVGVAAPTPDSSERHGGAGADQRHRVGLQASRRAGLPATGLVCDRSSATHADGDDDRWGVQHPRRLGADR